MIAAKRTVPDVAQRIVAGVARLRTRHRRSLRAIITAFLLAPIGLPLAAQESPQSPPPAPPQDAVWHEPAPRSSAEPSWLPQALRMHSGEIVSLDNDSLQVKDPAGEVTNIAVNRVVWLEPDWQNDIARQGMADFAAGRFGESVPNLLAAIQQRPPVWQQQWLTGHLALAAVEAEKFPAALELVQQLERSHLPTPMLMLLPIRWTSRPVGGSEIAAARQMIAAEEPMARLVAASWLLSSPSDRATAEQMLDALAADRRVSPWVAQLAEAVRWRRIPVPQIAAAADRWLEQIERMPIALQGGPLMAVADRLEAAGEVDRARELYLSVALLYKRPRPLADQARAALAARSVTTGE